MAQLGELKTARALLRRAVRAFAPAERTERARCIAAEAEIALAVRDLRGLNPALNRARRTFEAMGDHENALHTALIAIRQQLLLGRVHEASETLSTLKMTTASAMLKARSELIAFEIALRKVKVIPAKAALEAARIAATQSGIAALCAEVQYAERAFQLPAARLVSAGRERPLVIAEIEALSTSEHLVVDACRRTARVHGVEVEFARRPVLFALLRTLAESWPGDATRELLCERAFRARRIDESHRARLRVELGRLRKELSTLAGVQATPSGFALVPHSGSVLVLAPPVESDDAAVIALMADGEAWSTSALALALDLSQRTVQRVLADLMAAGKARALGNGRTRRWLAASVSEFATMLLLPTFVESR